MMKSDDRFALFVILIVFIISIVVIERVSLFVSIDWIDLFAFIPLTMNQFELASFDSNPNVGGSYLNLDLERIDVTQELNEFISGGTVDVNVLNYLKECAEFGNDLFGLDFPESRKLITNHKTGAYSPRVTGDMGDLYTSLRGMYPVMKKVVVSLYEKGITVFKDKDVDKLIVSFLCK